MQNDFVKEIDSLLTNRGISATVYDSILNGRSCIAIEIIDGDWKHDHIFVDNILSNNGFVHIENHITGDSTSDCYSAVHYYDTTKFRSLDYDDEITAAELCRQLKIVLAQCPDAVVTLRHTAGTDFPPFLTIESRVEHDKQEKAGAFENLWR